MGCIPGVAAHGWRARQFRLSLPAVGCARNSGELHRTDFAGRDLAQAVAALGLEVGHLQVHPDVPTGTVQVVSDARESRCTTRRAWPGISYASTTTCAGWRPRWMCRVFRHAGAARGETSRATIQQFVARCPDRALKIHDVNLRQLFFTKPLIEASLQLANVLKVSDEELPVLAALFGLRGAVLDQLRQLMDRFELRLVAYTRGAEGSLRSRRTRWPTIRAPAEGHRYGGRRGFLHRHALHGVCCAGIRWRTSSHMPAVWRRSCASSRRDAHVAGRAGERGLSEPRPFARRERSPFRPL